MMGHDKIGKFIMNDNRMPNKCGICREDAICLRYTSSGLHISSYIREAPSFLMRNRNKWIRTIGITCGCYAKVHRQMVHIESGEMNPARGERRV
jgi:hypothetical protein